MRLASCRLVENREELRKMVMGCLEGKRKYQRKFFELFYGKMMAICMRYARSEEEAKDIVQNGFIKVFNHLDSYNFEWSLEGWIRKIMVNSALDQIRKNKHRPFSIADDQQIRQTEEPPPPLSAEEEAFLLNIKAEEAIGAISKLPTACRTVFNLYVIEGFTHSEIAAHLGISEGTSKSNLAKAKQKLRAKLSEKFRRYEEK